MKAFLVAATCGILMALTGCSGSFSGTARGLFIGYVTDKTEEEVIAFCREHLSKFKVPTVVAFAGELPRT